MMFTLQFTTDNEAFSDGNAQSEIARILHKVAEQVKQGSEGGRIMDINGNSVGDFGVND